MNAVQTKALATPAKKNTPFFEKESSGDLFHFSRYEQPFFSKRSNHVAGIQAKLGVNVPGDIYEKEADATADSVVKHLADPAAVRVQSSSPVGTVTPFIQKKCAHCEEEEKSQKKEDDQDLLKDRVQKKPAFESNDRIPEEEKNIQRKCSACKKEEKLQKKSDGSFSKTASPDIENKLASSKGSGRQLPSNTQQQMGSSFGADFSTVRVHEDSAAVQMNKDLNAQAFTHGNDIYFNSGKYDVNGNSGKHLLAHELTHVVQQGMATPQNAKSPNNRFTLPGINNSGKTNSPIGHSAVDPVTVNKPGSSLKLSDSHDQGSLPRPTGTDVNLPGEIKNRSIDAPVGGKSKTAPGAIGVDDESKPAGNKTVTAAPDSQLIKSAAGAAPTGSIMEAGQQDNIGLAEERIKNAKDSDLKADAITQSAYLNADAANSLFMIDQVAAMRKLSAENYVTGIRLQIDDFFIGKSQEILNAILGKQAAIMQTTSAAMAGITAFVAGITDQALSISTQTKETISSAISSSGNMISASVDSIAGQITRLITAIPLPDIPGVSILRNMVISIVNSAAGAVRNVVNTVGSFLQNILSAATQAVTTIVSSINGFIMTVLNNIFKAIMDLQVLLFNKVNEAGQRMLAQLNEFLYGNIYPVLDEAENYYKGQIDKMSEERKKEILANQLQVLEALADVVAPKPKSLINPGAKKGSRKQQLLYQQQITQYGITRNAKIVQSFKEDTSSIYNMVRAAVDSFVDRLHTAVVTSINKLIDTVSGLVSDFIDLIAGLVQKGIDAFLNLLTSLGNHLAHLVTGVATVLTKIGEKIISFINDIPGRAGPLVRTSISSFIVSGSAEAAGAPVLNYAGGLGPEIQALLQEIAELEPLLEEAALVAEEAAEVVVVVEETALVAEETAEVVVVGWEVILIIIIVILILIIIALLVYLIYLIIEEILKPVPVPVPVPVPIPVPVPVPVPDPEPEPEEPCDVFPLGFHRGGNARHNNCADVVPPNIHPGSDIEVIHELLGRKSFDALDPVNNLWEVKTENYSSFPPFLRTVTMQSALADIAVELPLATVCGFGYVFGVTDPEFFADLLAQIPFGVDLRLINC